MNVFEAVQSLLAVRSYEDRPIPDNVVTRILQAARLTGSSRNRQEWEFLLIRDQEMLQRLSKLASTGSYIKDAAMVIAVVIPDKEVGLMDGARATQDMMLVAWEAGVGSNWVGNANTEEIKALLGVPAEKRILNLIPFGYPQEKIGDDVDKDRKPLSEIVHEGRYGQPYAG